MLRAVLDAASATVKDGWSQLPEGRTLTLHVAHDGVSLSISKVEAFRVVDGVLQAKNSKGELYLVGHDDVFAAALDRPADPASGGRKAGFLG
jgi:hypothetical protein